MSDTDTADDLARKLAGFGMRTTPGPMGPTARYRIVARAHGDDRPVDQDARMAVDGVERVIRYARRIVMTGQGLLVLPTRIHGRDHHPTYLFPDVDLPRFLIGRALFDARDHGAPDVDPEAHRIEADLIVRLADVPEIEVGCDITGAEASIAEVRAVMAAHPTGPVLIDEEAHDVVTDPVAVDLFDGSARAAFSTGGDFEAQVAHGLLVGFGEGHKSGEGTAAMDSSSSTGDPGGAS